MKPIGQSISTGHSAVLDRAPAAHLVAVRANVRLVAAVRAKARLSFGLGLLAIGVMLGVATAGPAGAQTNPSSTNGDLSPWLSCPLHGVEVECATLVAPLDYHDPDGPTLELSVKRIKATVANGGRGSLVINPGGPGVPSTGLLLALARSGELTDWDLVGFDPRAVGLSSPMSCELLSSSLANVADGNPYEQVTQANERLISACQLSDGPVFASVTTTNVARDMDLLRDALGEQQLDYLGYSHGTHLGAVYASLFPERVGRFVLDGPVILDDITRVTTAQIRGFEDALERIDAACEAAADCALSPFGAKRVWRHLAWRLRTSPETILASGGSVMVDESVLYSATAAAIYSGRAAWPSFAQAVLDATWGDPAALVALSDSWRAGSSFAAARLAVLCNDVPLRPTVNEAQQAVYQEILAGNSSWAEPLGVGIAACRSVAPSPEAVRSLEVADGATNPMLVIAKTHDPATPYDGALEFVDRIGPSRLLTVNDDGHTSFGQGDVCVSAAVRRYLIDGTVPAPGAVCTPAGLLGIVAAGATPGGGVAVARTLAGSPSDGLVLPGDVIIAIDRATLPPPPFVAGQTYAVTLRRGQETITVVIAAANAPYWLP